jgi:hypothetical protein
MKPTCEPRRSEEGLRLFLNTSLFCSNCTVKNRRGRHLAIAVGYVRAVEAIRRRHGLGARVGLAFDYLKGDKGENIESRFQRFGRLALAAVGDRSGVSRWQVKKVKLRAKKFDKESKPLKA